MLIFILNLPAPIFTLIGLGYLALLVHVLVSIGKSDQSLVNKFILLAIMVMVPLAPIFYLIFRSPTKSSRNTQPRAKKRQPIGCLFYLKLRGKVEFNFWIIVLHHL